MPLPPRTADLTVNTPRNPRLADLTRLAPDPFQPHPRTGETVLGEGDPAAPFALPPATPGEELIDINAVSRPLMSPEQQLEELPNVIEAFRRAGTEAFLAMAKAVCAEDDSRVGGQTFVGPAMMPWSTAAHELAGSVEALGALWPALEVIMAVPSGGRERAWRRFISLLNEMHRPGPEALVHVLKGLTARGY